MLQTAFINIWGKQVGAIFWKPETEICTFEFDPKFIKNNWDIAPIKMPVYRSSGKIYSFPELRGTNTFKGLPGVLADILPDRYGHALINTWLTRQGRQTNSLNPVEMLCFIGSRGIGALEIEPGISHSDGASSKIELGSIIGIAGEILSGRKDFSTNLSENEEKALLDILKIGTSAGGARAKALIAINSEIGEIRSGQTMAPDGFDQWMIKFDGIADEQFGVSNGYGRVEMAYYLMALDAGIEMSECRLLEENNRAHFMTKRFDRGPGGSKIHFQSFCALQHFDFNEVLFFSYEQLFETMRILGLPYPQAEELFRRMVFNVLGKNCDDHTKNFGFVMDQNGNWKLSPAYDICHAYRPGSEWVSQHALSVNGKRKNILKDDLIEVAYQMNIKKASKIISHIAAIINNWEKYARQVQVNTALQNAIGQTLIRL